MFGEQETAVGHPQTGLRTQACHPDRGELLQVGRTRSQEGRDIRCGEPRLERFMHPMCRHCRTRTDELLVVGEVPVKAWPSEALSREKGALWDEEVALDCVARETRRSSRSSGAGHKTDEDRQRSFQLGLLGFRGP